MDSLHAENNYWNKWFTVLDTILYRDKQLLVEDIEPKHIDDCDLELLAGYLIQMEDRYDAGEWLAESSVELSRDIAGYLTRYDDGLAAKESLTDYCEEQIERVIRNLSKTAMDWYRDRIEDDMEVAKINYLSELKHEMEDNNYKHHQAHNDLLKIYAY